MAATPGVLDASRFEYQLEMRQQPKQARICNTEERRPIDPPPVCRLRIVDLNTSATSCEVAHQGVIQSPHFFCFAALCKPDSEEEIKMPSGKSKISNSKCIAGSSVSSLYHLKDPQQNNQYAAFFVFPDLGVRLEGQFRFKLSMYEIRGSSVVLCAKTFTDIFRVYDSQRFPGHQSSTPLSQAFADQGIRMQARRSSIQDSRPTSSSNPQEISNTSFALKRPLSPESYHDDERPHKIPTDRYDPRSQAAQVSHFHLPLTTGSRSWPPTPFRPVPQSNSATQPQIREPRKTPECEPAVSRSTRRRSGESDFRKNYGHLLEPPKLPPADSRQFVADNRPRSAQELSQTGPRRSSDPVISPVKERPRYLQREDSRHSVSSSTPDPSRPMAAIDETNDQYLPSRSQSPATLEHGRTLLSLASILNPPTDRSSDSSCSASAQVSATTQPAEEVPHRKNLRLPSIQDLLNPEPMHANNGHGDRSNQQQRWCYENKRQMPS